MNMNPTTFRGIDRAYAHHKIWSEVLDISGQRKRLVQEFSEPLGQIDQNNIIGSLKGLQSVSALCATMIEDIKQNYGGHDTA